MVLYVRDNVEKDFLSISGTSSVFEGAKAMKNSRHGFAIIGTPAGPEGVVNEWDLVSRVVSEGQDPRSVTMQEVMTKNILSIGASTSFSVVSQIITEKGVRRLLVKEGNRVAGFITSITMLARMNDYVDKISAQQAGCGPPGSERSP